jgi:excisionase family DNA binding protein
MKEKKNDNRVSVRELAEALRVSTDTVRRAYRKGEIPAIRVKTALRFDLREVHTCMQQNAVARFGTRSSSAPGGTAGRVLDDQPPPGKTGAQFLGNGS